MKRYLISNKVTEIQVIVEVGWNQIDSIAASEYKGFNVPEGDLPPAEKDALINSQVLADYHSFIESVEDLLSDYYDLDIYYKNDSPDNSFYFGMVAKNSDGSVIFDFEFLLRISTHEAHRSKKSKQHKKEMKEALKEKIGDIKLKPVRRSIIVNNKAFNSYMDAYEDVDHQVEEVVQIMTKKQN